MLEYLRNASNRPAAKVLMGLLIFSFVGWGVADWVFGGSMRDNIIATVGDTDISANQFQDARTRAIGNLSRDMQKQIYTDPAAMNAFNNRVLSDIINDTLILNRADDLGFYVSDKRIAAEIREFPEFAENGKFSAAKFYQIMAASRMSQSDFADYLRGQILRGYTLGGIGVPIPVSEFSARAAYNARYATRAIEFATVKFSDFAVGKPTEADLREFYAANPKTVSETRKVSYALVSADMTKPDQVEAAFERAQKLEDAIIAGEAMADAAKANGAKFVSVKAFARDTKPADSLLDPVLVEKIWNTDAANETELLETKSGFMIIRVDDVVAAHIADFADVRAGLADAWKKDRQKKQAYIRANDMLVDINAGKKVKMTTATVSRASGAPTDVLNAAFGQGIGENAIVAGTDAFYVLRVEKEVAPKVDAAKMATLRKELANMQNRQIMDDYNAFLIRRYPVKVNEKTLNKIFGK